MLYTLFGLIVADGLITTFLVTNGYALEANPFLQEWVREETFLDIKISAAFLVTLLLWIKYDTKPKLIFMITTAFVAIYTNIVFWNLSVFLANH